LAAAELCNFIREQCQRKGLSLRSLSVNAGLSPGTVHSIIKREYQPTLFSLNCLADYLGVKREYLWKLAGHIQDMDCSDIVLTDRQLKYHFERVDRMSPAAKSLVISIIESLADFLENEKTAGVPALAESNIKNARNDRYYDGLSLSAESG